MKSHIFLFGIFFLLYLKGFSQGAQQKSDTVQQQKPDTSKQQKLSSLKTIPDSILRISNLNSLKDSGAINDIIAIKLQTQKPFYDFDTLYINGIKVEGTKPWKQNASDATVFFQLDNNVKNLVDSFNLNKSVEKNIIPVYFSVASKNQGFAKASDPFYLELKQKSNRYLPYLAWIIGLGVFVIAIIAIRKNALKDDNNLYYSLSRVQLFYWTIVIVFCYLILSSHTGVIPDIPGSVLTILGISLGTTALGKVIDNNNKDKVTIDLKAKSEGLLYDILSDGTSINIQRFQNVVFNLVFGVIFIQMAFATWKLPVFDNNMLLLLGISSGAYAGLKTTEATKDQNKPLPPVVNDPANDPEKKKNDQVKTD